VEVGGAAATSPWAPVVVALVAFAAAAVAGVRAGHAGRSRVPWDSGPLTGVGLLAPDSEAQREPLIVRVFGATLVWLLLMYVLFDRAFAWLHVPGTTLFVGEMVIALGIFAVLSTRVPLGPGIRRSPAFPLLVTWMAWGAGLLVIAFPAHGLDALRDSALWYYGVTGVFALFLLLSDRSRLGRWVDAYRRALPITLIWLPIAIVLRAAFSDGPPFVPDTQISIFAHRSGNIAVFCAIAIGFIWLVDREKPRLTPGQRSGYTVLAVFTILIAGIQNRGGLVAAVLGMVAMLFLMRRRRAELGIIISGVVVALVTIGLMTDARLPLSSSGRAISAQQLADNLVSVIHTDAGGDRQTATTRWRLDLWGAVFDDVVNESPIIGFGPGPDLGERYGVSGPGEIGLRNPHNSHLGVLARMGFVGGALWVALWLVWVMVLYRLRARLRAAGRLQETGFMGWLVVSAMMILVNAVFDPTLEGPQVAMWLWMIFGVGAALPVLYTVRSGSTPAPRVRRRSPA
jgi:O-antigen ligase